jgi:hypothetical protein
MALLGRDTFVAGPFPKGVLLPETLAGTETLASPFVYELGLVSEKHELDAKDVLGQPMAVGTKLVTDEWRYFHGKDGRAKVESTKAGVFTVTFPDLDGADWDGDGAAELPPEGTRREASRHRIKKGDRLPLLACKKGFSRWRTVWDFVGNLTLKTQRKDPNVLFLDDEVSIPTKFSRVAHVSGGVAEFTCHRDDTEWLFDLCVRLQIDPRDSKEMNDIFCLSSSDGSVTIEETIADDQTPDDDNIDVVFERVNGDKAHTLRVKSAVGEYLAFDGLTGWDIHDCGRGGGASTEAPLPGDDDNEAGAT